ncbi:MAG: energy transducer TonB [Gemmatimonadota bacterium]|nr:energy transducer TonB [Gemmatimonadota bacterium]
MLNNLIESKAAKQKRFGGQAFSIIMHVVVVAGAVVLTANAGIINEKTKEEKVDFVEVKKDEPKPPEPDKPPPPPDVVVQQPPPKGFQVLKAPIEIPTIIPDIDLSKKMTDANDFTGKGVVGGTGKGVGSGPAPAPQGDQPYFEFQVEKPVVSAPGSPGPVFPDMLKSAGVEGQVLAQFVVDTTGRAEVNTFKVLKSDHQLFELAVKNALPRMRFLPAEVGGKKVKQLVQQPFQFSLTK